jgi:hypothetical protein
MKNFTVFVLILLTCQAFLSPASADVCIHRPEWFQLRSDTVDWNITIGAGRDCLQGLRKSSMLLDSVKIIEPAKFGIVTISGPSFRYQAPATTASDSFKIELTGEDRRYRGSSIVQVYVLVE